MKLSVLFQVLVDSRQSELLYSALENHAWLSKSWLVECRVRLWSRTSSAEHFLPTCTITESIILRHWEASSSDIATSLTAASPCCARLSAFDDLAMILFIKSTPADTEECRYWGCRHDDSSVDRYKLFDSIASCSGISSEMIRWRFSASTLHCHRNAIRNWHSSSNLSLLAMAHR